MTMLLPHDYNIDSKVKFPVPKFPQLAIGRIVKIFDKETRLRKESGYHIKIETPDELRGKVVYMQQRFIKELL